MRKETKYQVVNFLLVIVLVLGSFSVFDYLIRYQDARPHYTVNVIVSVPDGKFTYYTVSGTLIEKFAYTSSSNANFTGVGSLVFTPYADNGGQGMEKRVYLHYTVYLEVAPKLYSVSAQDKEYVLEGTP